MGQSYYHFQGKSCKNCANFNPHEIQSPCRTCSRNFTFTDHWQPAEPELEECHACEGVGDGSVHGLDPAPCSKCNGTGKTKTE
jgi:hypothetical protein